MTIHEIVSPDMSELIFHEREDATKVLRFLKSTSIDTPIFLDLLAA